MRRFLINPRALLVVTGIACSILLFNRCIGDKAHEPAIITHRNGQQFAGSYACRDCHHAICDSFLTTAHYLTSGIAGRENIKGSFAEGKNVFAFDTGRKVVMEEGENGMFQTVYTNGKKGISQRFDIVMGSGKKGQTYCYWRGGELYQLPISYFAGNHAWANSPGFSPDKISFSRNIEIRCMECHTTYARELAASEYIPGQIIYGVSCERCHGPAAKHVAFHSQHPDERRGRFIVNPASLSQQQRLDVCALCHSGTMTAMRDAFSFQPGDTLTNYFVRNRSHIDSFNLDVHANQYGLLTASKCFRMSGEAMTCGSCHNTHNKENGNLVAYGMKCMQCHSDVRHNNCSLKPPAGYPMVANCVNCHMPVKDSKKLTLLVNAGSATSPERVRSHLIAIDRAESQRILQGKNLP